jgi:predicted ATPase/DNA-binding SARP family transcriptional activator
VTVVLVLLPRVSYRDQEITRPRMRGLLALLAGDLRTGCSTARLVEGLWPDERPENPAKALQVLVSHARAQLGAGVIVSTPVGYRLSLEEDQVDASAVMLSASASARHSRAGDHAAALDHAEAGLALWKGAVGWDVELPDPLSALRAARAATYQSLVRARTLALSRLGRHAEAIEPLTDLAREQPRDEEILVELLRCEAATLGPPKALARYDAYRRSLRDELGSDPGPAVQDVYQQLLQSEMPPVRRGVPHEPNPLLGRDDDITAVADLLRTSRVTSIVGAGGLGKTRLAHVVSRQAKQRVVHLVALAGVTTDGDVVSEVASVLGVGQAVLTPAGRPAVPTDVLTGIITTLGPGPALLVLDNCEHVVHGAAELVHALVSMSKDLRVLTTSRAPLGLSSESVYLLPELNLPTTVELFNQRAKAARPGVDLPAGAVEELCGQLDGLPLAVELAAARVRIMSVAEIARRLDDRFALLRGGTRDAPPRHRTLHAVIDWSWNLLEPAGQAAMRALSIFPGGFSAEAAQHLLGAGDSLQVLEQLAGQSLLKVTDTGSGTRLRMLETVREFSTARRDEAGETDRVTGLFLLWARDFGAAHHDSVFGTDLVSAVARIRAEQDNLVLALRLGLDRSDGASVAAVSAALNGLWIIESNFPRMTALAKQTTSVLSHFRPGPALLEATRTALVLCVVSCFLLQGPRPARFLVALHRLAPAPPSTPIRAIDIVLRVMAEVPQPNLPALHVLCDNDDPLLAGIANNVASYVWEGGNDLDNALKAAQRTLTAFEDHAIPAMRALAHSRIGELCLQADRGDEARRHIAATLSVMEEAGAWSSAARVRWVMVLASLQCGAVDEAERWLEQAVHSGGDQPTDVMMFEFAVRAEIRLARGDAAAGLRLWRQAADRVRNTGSPIGGSSASVSASWASMIQAVTVIAHAHHDRLDLVPEIVGDLPDMLSRMITDPAPGHLPICGTILLALAMVDLDAGATTPGARMIALAEACRFPRDYQPTMSAERARQIAEHADRSAYADASSSYADLGQDALRAAVVAVLRDQVTERDPS